VARSGCIKCVDILFNAESMDSNIINIDEMISLYRVIIRDRMNIDHKIFACP